MTKYFEHCYILLNTYLDFTLPNTISENNMPFLSQNAVCLENTTPNTFNEHNLPLLQCGKYIHLLLSSKSMSHIIHMQQLLQMNSNVAGLELELLIRLP